MQTLTKFFEWVARGVTGRWGGRRALSSFLQQGSAIGLYHNSWTDSRYEQVRHFKHWVYVAVDKVATEVAMHSPNLSLIRSPRSQEERLRCIPRRFRNKAIVPLRAHEELEPVRDDNPLLRLLKDPNEPDTSFDLWYETTLFLLLTGNAYWWMPKNALGLPAAIWVLPSHWVWASVGRERIIDSYEVRPVEGNYMRMSIPAKDVIHFRKRSPVSKIDGFSPQTAGSQWIDTQESIDRTQWFTFRNGVTPGVSIGFDKGVDLPDEQTLNRIESKFMNRYSGEINSARPLFVPPGMSVRKLQLTPQELDFKASAEAQRDKILALFGVPASIAMLHDNLTYGSVRAADAAFYRSTINPLYRFYGINCTEHLCPRYDPRLRLWWEDRTPDDPDLLEKSLATDQGYGARTMNEVRALRGLEPYPESWADIPWVPLNTLPVDVAIALAKKKGGTEPGGGSPGRNVSTLTPAIQGDTPEAGQHD